MPHLTDASDDQIDAIYRESHELWGAGLTYDNYRGFWNELRSTPWAARHLHYRVWIDDDDGTVLSSLKLYRPTLRIDGYTGRAAGIGAVFTPRAHRRRGHASAMLAAVLDEARRRDDTAALLFSDVGTAFYRGLGFDELPAEEVWGELPRRPAADRARWTMRPMTVESLGDVMRFQRIRAANRKVAVVRDRDYWEYLLERSSRFFARLDGTDLSQRFQVAYCDGRLCGYLAAVDSGDVWIVREVGVAEGADDVAPILRMGAAQARARGLRRFYAWLPRSEVDAIPEFRTLVRRRRRAIPMVRLLDDRATLPSPMTVEGSFIPYLDQF